MADNGYLIIEWSGYLHFPNGTYQYGSKEGEPLSGVFEQEDVILSEFSSVDYAIDPGELTFPVSPTLSFSLKNRDKSSGVRKYPFSYIANIGRTSEYGGQNDEVGDLFIRVYSPILNKYIYRGFMESFEYTIYDMEVQIDCSDIMELIKTERGVMTKFDLGGSWFFIEDHLEEELSQDQDEIVNKFKPDSLPEFTGSKFVDRRNQDHVVQQFEIGNEPKGYTRYGGMTSIFPDPISYENLNKILKGVILNDPTEIFKPNDAGWSFFVDGVSQGRQEFPDYFKRVFANNIGEGSGFTISSENEEETQDVPSYFHTMGSITFKYWELTPGPTHCFLQVEDSTILSPVIPKLHVYYLFDNILMSHTMWIIWRVESVHANNGNVETKIEQGDLVIFERGRFLKSEDDPEEAIIENEDSVVCSVFDWSKYPNDDDIDFFLSEGWESVSFGDLTTFKENYIFHGVYFEIDSNGNLKASDNNRGVINPIDVLKENVNNKVFAQFIDNDHEEIDYYDYPSDFNLFDTSLVEEFLYKSCFVSDVVHYGFAEEAINDLIVNTARQVNAYVYSNEEGKIVYQSRDHFKKIFDPENISLFKEIFVEDYEEISGKKYGYGKLFYSISYNDKLEVNNLRSGEDIQLVVGREGITRRSVSPRSLEISNYRTTDLGVPDGITEDAGVSGGNLIILRDGLSPYDEDLFLMLPVQQAQLFANSYPYPTIVLPIKLDVLFSIDVDYRIIGIGSVIFIENEEEDLEIFMVKEISYNMKEIYEGGTSVNILLLQLGILKAEPYYY